MYVSFVRDVDNMVIASRTVLGGKGTLDIMELGLGVENLTR